MPEVRIEVREGRSSSEKKALLDAVPSVHYFNTKDEVERFSAMLGGIIARAARA